MKQSQRLSQGNSQVKEVNQFFEKQQISSKFKNYKEQIINTLNKVKCCQKNQVKWICSSSDCQVQNKFIYFNQQCNDHKLHETCRFIKASPFNRQIIENLIDSQKLIPKLESMFDKIIDIVSQKSIEFLNKLKLNIGLTSNQAKYVNNLCQNNRSQSYQRDFIQRILNQKNLSKIKRSNLFMNNCQQQIEGLKECVQQQINKIVLYIENYFGYFNSKIVKTQYQTKFLLTQLQKTIDLQSLSLIYRATQNNFSTDAFKQKCHQKSNLLFLVKNYKDKKYGAFTPCMYKKNQAFVYQKDDSMQSFLFTISDKTRYNLRNKQYTMYNQMDQVIFYCLERVNISLAV